jgi:CheY-like chemotaxis protein
MPRILVVDDSLSVRKALEKILNIYADVNVAISAEDALAQLHGGQAIPDLVISDVLMPGMSGFELTQELQKMPAARGVPVILISGIIDDDVQRRSLEVGARAVVRKPFTADELLPVIQRALEHLSSEVAQSALPVISAVVLPAQPVRAAQPPAPTGPVLVPQVAPMPRASVSTTGTGNPSSAHSGSAPDAATLVNTLIQKPGVLGVLVTTRDGTPLDHAGNLSMTPADLSMYARFFANTAGTLGTRLSSGEGAGVQLEYPSRTLLILPLDALHLLVCLLGDTSSGSMVRFAVRRHLTSTLAI